MPRGSAHRGITIPHAQYRCTLREKHDTYTNKLLSDFVDMQRPDLQASVTCTRHNSRTILI